MSEFSFNPSSHEYRLDGHVLVSVTQCLGKAGLIDSQWYTEASRERGRLVHLTTQLYDENDLEESTLDPILQPYLDAYKRFRDDTGFTPKLIEHRVCDATRRYAGTLDRQGELKNGEHVVLDLKSGELAWWVRLQLAAYSATLDGGPGMLRYGVQLRPDGQYRINTYRARDFRTDFNDYLCALRCAQMRDERR